MASSKKSSNIWLKVLGVLTVIVILSFIVYFLMMIPDYRLDFDGGPHWTPKTGMPVCSTFKIDNTIGKELTFSASIPDNISGVEYRVSYFKTFTWTGKTYQSSTGDKTVGGLTPEHTYYIQARYYRMNMMGRKVKGLWSSARPATVRNIHIANH